MRHFDDTMASVVRHETVRRSRGIEVLASTVTRQSRRAARRVLLWQRRGHAIPAGDNGDSPVRVGRPANDGFGSILRSDKTAAPYAAFATVCRSWRCEDAKSVPCAVARDRSHLAVARRYPRASRGPLRDASTTRRRADNTAYFNATA